MGKITSLSKDKFTIPAKSTQTLNFMGAEPNHFKIINGGNTALYVGISMMPTEHFFDSKIPAQSSKMVVDAYPRNEIYIYNPSDYDANIIITSFYEEFNSTTMAMADFGVDFAEISLSGEFDAKGDLKENLSNIKNSVADTEDNTESIKNNTEGIKNNITSLASKVSTLENTVKDLNNNHNVMIELLQGLQDPESATNTIQNAHLTWEGFMPDFLYLDVPEGYYISKINCAINNSGESFILSLKNPIPGTEDYSFSTEFIIPPNSSITFNQNLKVEMCYVTGGGEGGYNSVHFECKPYREIIEEVVINEGEYLNEGDVIVNWGFDGETANDENIIAYDEGGYYAIDKIVCSGIDYTEFPSENDNYRTFLRVQIDDWFDGGNVSMPDQGNTFIIVERKVKVMG